MQKQEEGVHQVSREQSGSAGESEQSSDRGVKISEGALHGSEELTLDEQSLKVISQLSLGNIQLTCDKAQLETYNTISICLSGVSTKPYCQFYEC